MSTRSFPEPPLFHRYVALGDSGTEGVGDEPHPDGSLRGMADRLAELLAEVNPGLLYANLAVRGHRAFEAHAQQLGPALALEPDLVTVIAGINDIIRPRTDLDDALSHMDEMLRALSSIGATMVTAAYPDVSAINPLARLARQRLHYFNQELRAIAISHGALVVDGQHFPATDRTLWCDDRLHLSPAGHRSLAVATAHTLGFAKHEVSDEPGLIESGRRDLRRLTEEFRWARSFLLPWIFRRLTGRSSGDGREPKRPHLRPVTTQPGSVFGRRTRND